MVSTNRDYVDASPTKNFFVEMITKDVDLDAAIRDLVDNSMDGAIRLRGTESFDDIAVRITYDVHNFVITDNCGGIPDGEVYEHAFRFGRPPGAEPVPHSVGSYGVGLKRSLFKIGSEFTVESATDTFAFRITVVVSEWLADPDPQWHFPIERLAPGDLDFDGSSVGTRVRIRDPYGPVARSFQSDHFTNALRSSIERVHQDALERGADIEVQGYALSFYEPQLLHSTRISPAVRTLTLDEDLSLKLVVGVGDSDPRRAGWYVYGNGRLILDANQDDLTGWGQVEHVDLPRYHNQFSMFRGFAYITSSNPARLPWNTTKTSVDQSSDVYQAAFGHMVSMMRPVIDFLNHYDAERDLEDGAPRPRTAAIDQARAQPRVSPKTASGPRDFTFIEARPAIPSTITIQYVRPRFQVSAVQLALGVRSAKAAGQATFDLFYEEECDVSS